MAGYGGKRKGAGRKPGGANKKTAEIANRAAAEGITPLEYMLMVMRDENATRPERIDAAKSAAPYIHPRLASVENKIKSDLIIEIQKYSDAEKD